MLRAVRTQLQLRSQSALQLIKKSEALKQSVILSFGNFVTAGVMAVTTILLARVLGPEQFGVFSVVVAILFLITKGTDLGIHQLIPRLYHRWQAHPGLQAQLMVWVQNWKLKLSLGLLVISGIAIPWLQTYTQIADPVLLWLAIMGAILLGWYEYVHLSLSAKHSFTQVSILTILLAVFKFVGFSAIAGFLYYTNGTIITSSTDSNSTTILRLFTAVYCLAPVVAVLWWKQSKWKVLEKQATWKISEEQAITDGQESNQQSHVQSIRKAARRFLPHAFVGTIAMTFIENIDILLVNNQLSAFETGLYSGAVRVTLAVSLITYAVSSVLNNRVTRYSTPEQLKSYLLKSLSLTAMAFVCFVITIPLAKPIILYTIGSEYIGGLIPFIVLVGNAFLGFALVPYTSFFFRLDVPWANSVGGILQVVPLVVINLLFLNSVGIIAAALARVVSTVLFALLVIWLVWRSWKKEFADAI
jgi:O-antigen/teichoic acid export membrane protein